MLRISLSMETKALPTCDRFGDGDLISREEMVLKRALVAQGISEVPREVNFKWAFNVEVYNR